MWDDGFDPLRAKRWAAKARADQAGPAECVGRRLADHPGFVVAAQFHDGVEADCELASDQILHREGAPAIGGSVSTRAKHDGMR